MKEKKWVFKGSAGWLLFWLIVAFPIGIIYLILGMKVEEVEEEEEEPTKTPSKERNIYTILAFGVILIILFVVFIRNIELVWWEWILAGLVIIIMVLTIIKLFWKKKK